MEIDSQLHFRFLLNRNQRDETIGMDLAEYESENSG